MYTPKPGEPAVLLWFVSGIGLPAWSPFERQIHGTTCYLARFHAMRPDPDPRKDFRTSADPPRTPNPRAIFLN